ncbi:IPT/TIG domain-containing protein [bacterium]|nr:IPT/TIG domain-containing protein [bacterium]
MEKKIGVLVCLLLSILLIIFVGCSQDDGDDNGNGNGEGPTEEQLDQVEAYLAKQEDYHGEYENLLAEMDTSSAIDSLVSMLISDPDIESAIVAGPGVNITWANGMRGGVETRKKRTSADGKISSMAKPLSPPGYKENTTLNAPIATKSIFLSPCYSEFHYHDDYVISMSNHKLTEAGYDTFTLYKNQECSVERICGFTGGNYGIIRISSHGISWPSDANVQEVYLVTGEIPTRDFFIRNWEHIENSLIMSYYISDTNRLCINSTYFAMFNDFGSDLPFVSLAFCYAGLGNWPANVFNNCGAGAVIAWDWAVMADTEAVSIEDFFDDMCDTSRAYPLTAQEWYNTADTRMWLTCDSRNVNMSLTAVDSFALLLPFRITSLFPEQGLNTDIYIIGKGFGDSDENCSVRIGDIETDEISMWTDESIRVYIRSDNLPIGEVPVRVVRSGKESNSKIFYNGVKTDIFHSFNLELYINKFWTDLAGSHEEYGQTDVPPQSSVSIYTDFISDIMNMVLDTINPSSGALEHIEIAMTVDNVARIFTDISIIWNIEYTDGSTSYLTFNAENIPIVYNGFSSYYAYGNPMQTAQATLEGGGICANILNYTYQEFDSSGTPYYTLDSYNCDSTSSYPSMDIYILERPRFE